MFVITKKNAMGLNEKNTTEKRIKDFIKEIEKVENMYLDKKNVLIELKRIISKKEVINVGSYN